MFCNNKSKEEEKRRINEKNFNTNMKVLGELPKFFNETPISLNDLKERVKKELKLKEDVDIMKVLESNEVIHKLVTRYVYPTCEWDGMQFVFMRTDQEDVFYEGKLFVKLEWDTKVVLSNFQQFRRRPILEKIRRIYFEANLRNIKRNL